MKLLPVALAIFYRKKNELLEVWTQIREDDGIYHGLLEFPGGKIELCEEALSAAVREVHEEVGITIDPNQAQFFGVYPLISADRTILLNVFLFPDQSSLLGRGEWLAIKNPQMSSTYQGKIPAPNHQIIDDLYRSLYS